MAPFGRYELVRLLDHGGMGEVWLARVPGPERVHKTVVLKRIRAERANDDAARTRFAEEARVAISLSHPHIVPVFEFGQLEGAYFLAMEWLRGGNLARVAGIDRDPLPWAATALIATQLCDALAYVHARRNKSGARLVHGDVTPRNVLFSTDGHALLADFGLARFAGSGRAGTLRYQSPEQARGEAFDARADLYALALVLCEAATGRAAYDRDAELAAKQAKVGVIPELAGCEEGLASVLRRALAASVDGRFADAAAMRAAFEALLDREPGARAAGRAEIIGRCGTPTAGDAGEGSRTGTLATREATVAAPPSRRGMGAAAAMLLLGGATLWVVRATRHPAAPAAERAAVVEASSHVVAAPPPEEPQQSRDTAGPVASPPPVTATRSTTPAAASPAAGSPTSASPARRVEPPRVPSVRPPEAPALLDVNASPWAHVRIDGKARGETPLLGLKLPPGTHTVELTNEPLGIDRALTITLKSSEHARVVEDLTR
ncbi:MAG: serine/threonine protein kinase [Myxococcales bacterium]|nr:serine/threonine protein kinase [Myxococcales bacterium]